LLAAELGKDKQAQEALSMAFEDAPEVPELARSLAWALVDRGEYESAGNTIRLALTHHPDDAYLLELRSWLARVRRHAGHAQRAPRP
jgi:Flp pilus assembly protein TadD